MTGDRACGKGRLTRVVGQKPRRRDRWLRQLVHALFNDETDEWKPQRRA